MKVRIGFVSNSSSCSFMIYGSSNENLTEEMAEKLENADFEVWDRREMGYGTCYFGRSISAMDLDETKREFQNKIERELSVLLNEEINCNWLSESWYDG